VFTQTRNWKCSHNEMRIYNYFKGVEFQFKLEVIQQTVRQARLLCNHHCHIPFIEEGHR